MRYKLGEMAYEAGGDDPMEFPYKAALEEFLETGLRAQGNPLVKVTIADDGETATVQIADKYTQYRLSPQAQERLRTGAEVFLVGDERFLLPMDEPNPPK